MAKKGELAQRVGTDIEKFTSVDASVAEAGQVLAWDPTAEEHTYGTRMNFKGNWDSLETYGKGDVVTDGTWLLHANKQTQDRAAPQPSGDPEYAVPEDVLWQTSSNTGSIESGHTYTFSKAGWIKRIRIWVPEVASDVSYRVILLDISDPANPTSSILETPTLVPNEWNVIAVGDRIVSSSTVLRTLLVSTNSSGTTNISGGWRKDTNDQSLGPATQEWNQNNQGTIVRISTTDLDSVDRTTELASVTPDSTIRFVQTADTTKYEEFIVVGTAVNQGTYVEYPTIKVASGPTGSVDVGAVSTADIDVPIADTTRYVESIDQWSTQPSFAEVEGYLEVDGVVAPVPNSAFGIDIQFQEAYVSPDWDFLSVGGLTGSAGGLSEKDRKVLDSFEPSEGDDFGITTLGQMAIGTWDSPQELVVGGGDSTTDTMRCLHTDSPNDDLPYTDVTDILSSDTGSTTGLFDGTAAGKTIYVGGDFLYAGVKVKLSADGGIEPANVIAEYWDGTQWQEVAFMSTNADFPHQQYGWNIAQNGVTSEQWRFNADPTNTFADWQKSTIDGIEKYWGRFRIVSAITSDATVEQIKLHTSRWECNASGFTEYFGFARYKKELQSGVQNLINNAVTSPANQDVTYETGVTIADYSDNQFNNNTIDSSVLVQNIVSGLDTSIPLELDLSYYVEGTITGDIEWQVKVYKVQDGFTYNGLATPDIFTVVDSVLNNSNLIRRSTKVLLDVRDLTDEDAILVNITRDATGSNPTDTLQEDVVLTNTRISAYFWKP